MHILCFYVPIENVEEVKNALFSIGAGQLGHYDCCAWQTLGSGQFRPLQGANPSIGKIDAIENVQEYKVEMICDSKIIEKVVKTLKEVHPYEEVAYYLTPCY